MNKVILSGNSTKDIELIKSGNVIMGKFTIAVSRTHKNEYGNYDTDFIDCVIFNPLEYVEKNLKKGCRLLIEGSIQKSSRDDKSGNKIYYTNIVVNNVEIYKNQQATQQPKEENPYAAFGNSIKTEFDVGHQIEIDESDYPF